MSKQIGISDKDFCHVQSGNRSQKRASAFIWLTWLFKVWWLNQQNIPGIWEIWNCWRFIRDFYAFNCYLLDQCVSIFRGATQILYPRISRSNVYFIFLNNRIFWRCIKIFSWRTRAPRCVVCSTLYLTIEAPKLLIGKISQKYDLRHAAVKIQKSHNSYMTNGKMKWYQ